MHARPFKHAAVLGAGMAGLVTARVLADYFEKVTLFERDLLPESPGFRPGVPQGRHFHALMPGGLFVLSGLLPGFTDDLKAAGSLLPAPGQFYYYRPEGKSFAMEAYAPNPRPDNGMRVVYVQTRGLLEHCVRRRVRAIENVEVRDGTSVVDIVSSEGHVEGVRVGDGSETVAADLVVDALGRGGRTLKWLDQLGFDRPAEDVIHCDFAYTSMFMRPRAPDLFTDVGFFVLANDRNRGGSLVRMEDGTWLVQVCGRHGDYPPRELAAFHAFAATTGSPRFMELLSQAEPVTETAHYRFARETRRRFERLTRFPEGLLPIGDSICHYNPLYAQGMSVACRQAKALHGLLAARVERGAGLDGLWREHLPKAYQETRLPWLFASLWDFEHPRCTGDFPVDEEENIRLFNYIKTQSLGGDPEALNTFLVLRNLIGGIDILSRSPWPERLAAANGAPSHSRAPATRGLGGVA